MKKILLLLCVALASLGAANAQTSLVATLSHDGNISTFYSANAFKDAYNAAVSGDVITLSSGDFVSPGNIKKNITVRGAGMMGDLTSISGNVYVYGEVADSLFSPTFEGVYFLNEVRLFEAENPSLLKCRINELTTSSSKLSNCRIIHCICDNANITAGSFVIVNSYLVARAMSANTDINNSIIDRAALYYFGFKGTMKNCIILGSNSDDYLAVFTSALLNNCVYVGASSKFFTNDKNLLGDGNKSFPENTPVFKEGTTTYELTDENKIAWLGTDGTEVGMHGGSLPFDPTPSNPQVTKFTVAPKTTADGKLSVDIEVKAN